MPDRSKAPDTVIKAEKPSRIPRLRELARQARESSQGDENVDHFQRRGHADVGGTEREERASSPPEILSPEERRTALKASIDAASVRDFESLERLIKRSKLAAAFGLARATSPLEAHLPSVAPALWEERETGRKVSPAEFIRKHYGSWLGKGLTRAHIGKLDAKLYAAYGQQVKRKPEEAVKRLPSNPHKHEGHAADILEERRSRDRERKKSARHLS